METAFNGTQAAVRVAWRGEPHVAETIEQI
jgi:hypothetical protein